MSTDTLQKRNYPKDRATTSHPKIEYPYRSRSSVIRSQQGPPTAHVTYHVGDISGQITDWSQFIGSYKVPVSYPKSVELFYSPKGELVTSDLAASWQKYFESVNEFIGDAQILGAVSLWTSELDLTKEAIRDAFNSETPEISLRKILEIWQKLDNVSELAKARSRILLKQVESPQLADAPQWLVSQLNSLRSIPFTSEGLSMPCDEVFTTTERLIRGAIARSPNGAIRATLSRAALGRISVDWHVGDARLQWLVHAADLPWPGVLVHVYSRGAHEQTSASYRGIYHTAAQVVDHFVTFVQKEKNEPRHVPSADDTTEHTPLADQTGR